MAEEPMTLEERLTNPQWVQGPDSAHAGILDTGETLSAMEAAAAEIKRLTIDRDAWKLTAKTYSRAIEAGSAC